MKRNKLFIVGFIALCILALFVVYLYPVVRTVIMSFFKTESVTSGVSDWSFNGLANYAKVSSSPTFQRTVSNILIIWVLGGAIVLGFTLLSSVIIISGIRLKKSFRAVIYLPNITGAVTLATTRAQYIYNQGYDLINQTLRTMGLERKNWLGTDIKFWAMLAAFTFGAVGHYVLIFINGIKQIPVDIYETTMIDGANKVQQFDRITMSLLHDIFEASITFQSINCVTFYSWSKMFSPANTEVFTVTPVVYLYGTVFGTIDNIQRDAGAGAAIGIVIAVFIGIVYFLMNKLFGDDDLGY